MPILTLAQTKGGSGKTTTAEVLIAEFTHRGASVAALDPDPNRPLGRFVARTLMQPSDASQIGRAQAGEEKLEVAIGGHGEVRSGCSTITHK